jgi:hypothetical protein
MDADCSLQTYYTTERIQPTQQQQRNEICFQRQILYNKIDMYSRPWKRMDGKNNSIKI